MSDFNVISLHPYRSDCPCIVCVTTRERSPGNEQMAYQRRLATALVYPTKGKGSR